MMGFADYLESPTIIIGLHKHPRKYMYLTIDGVSYKPMSIGVVKENPQDFTIFSPKLTLPKLKVEVDLVKYGLKFTEGQLVEFRIVTVTWKPKTLPHKNFIDFNVYYLGDKGCESTFLVSGLITWS